MQELYVIEYGTGAGRSFMIQNWGILDDMEVFVLRNALHQIAEAERFRGTGVLVQNLTALAVNLAKRLGYDLQMTGKSVDNSTPAVQAWINRFYLTSKRFERLNASVKAGPPEFRD